MENKKKKFKFNQLPGDTLAVRWGYGATPEEALANALEQIALEKTPVQVAKTKKVKK